MLLNRLLFGAISVVVAGTTCSLLLVWLLGRAGRLPLDYPNERSLHDRPIPRIGGLGVVPGLIVGWVWVADRGAEVGLAVALAACLFLLSAIDDRRGLPVGIRFGGHLLASLALAVGVAGGLGWVAALVIGLAIAWMTNLYNFMDGANGLAGGMTAFGFGAYGLAAATAGADALTALSLAAAGAAIGFLRFNFDPVRLFLGDAGSIPLGFLAGALGLIGVVDGVWPWWYPLLVFSPFIVDASATLLRRALRGERVWQAHRDHYYQRLIRMGWGHRRLALTEYALMGGAAASAFLLRDAAQAAQWTGIGAWLLAYVGLMSAIDRRWTQGAAA